jgi:hypothetical protein
VQARQGYPYEREEESPLPQFLEVRKTVIIRYGTRDRPKVQPFSAWFLLFLGLVVWLRQLHLNQDGIKRGGVAHIGKFF